MKGDSVCDRPQPIISCVRRAPVRGRGAGTGCRRSSTVEHSFRKAEVMGSNPIVGCFPFFNVERPVCTLKTNSTKGTRGASTLAVSWVAVLRHAWFRSARRRFSLGNVSG